MLMKESSKLNGKIVAASKKMPAKLRKNNTGWDAQMTGWSWLQ
jgi:hypothetical protein